MNERERTKDGRSGGEGSDTYEWLQCVVAALLVCIAAFTFFFRLIDVAGHSMEPTLQNGDKVIVSCRVSRYEPGDIVVLRKDSFKDEPIVKRIIAVGGQTVDIDFDAGVVYVDGKALDEPYIYEPTRRAIDFTEPVTVPDGCVFVLGDHRSTSVDSRSSVIGFIKEDETVGQIVMRVWPLKNFGLID